jgi:hypothetical protein
MHPKALSLFPAAGLLGGVASITLFYAFTWLSTHKAVRRYAWPDGLGFQLHIIFWSLIAQAALAGAVGGLVVGSACPPRWSGPTVGVLAAVVGLVATAGGIIGILGEILTRKGPPFANLAFLGVLAPLLAIAGLTWCVGLMWE